LDEGVLLIPLIIYLDGTWLSSNGRQNGKPLSMTIGNINQSRMNKNDAKRLIAYMPAIPGSKRLRKSARYKRAKRAMYHKVLEDMLLSVRAASTAGRYRYAHYALLSRSIITQRVYYCVSLGRACDVALCVFALWLVIPQSTRIFVVFTTVLRAPTPAALAVVQARSSVMWMPHTQFEIRTRLK
jgi:hypothetical protein